MTQVQPTTHDSVESEGAALRQQHLAQTPIDHILQKLSRTELPANMIMSLTKATYCSKLV